MRHFNHDVTSSLEYTRSLFAPEDELLSELSKELVSKNKAISIGPEEGKILQLFIQLSNIKTIIEIGTLGGYSTIWMARALPEDGHIYTFEKSTENVLMAQNYINQSDVSNKITVIEGSALDMLATIESKAPFDMAFIDADKRGYCNYLDWCEQNIKKDGLVIGDNTFLFGAVYQETLPTTVKESTKKIMQDFNARLANSEKYNSIIIPTEQGMTIAQKKF